MLCTCEGEGGRWCLTLLLLLLVLRVLPLPPVILLLIEVVAAAAAVAAAVVEVVAGMPRVTLEPHARKVVAAGNADTTGELAADTLREESAEGLRELGNECDVINDGCGRGSDGKAVEEEEEK